ncbi:hypothetical protein ACFFIX_21035 [Metabacillus herbersteinensis]|uniref:Uncharacterized protein n=1 Tax=Metabacillus herbersteinensis TaxID=283816 RepID=A0ABV6GJK0_9BACI
MKKNLFILVILFPFLLSLDSGVYDSSYYAKYQSPEGILFLSYSQHWDENKLEKLYEELLKNNHGEEIDLLQEVRVRGESLDTTPTRGSFHALTNTITLYQGDTYRDPSDYTETLSHEYGHHFSYFHFKSHHFPFSTYHELRKLKEEPIRWDAFWNYTNGHHKWFPQEIIADDYLLLFGPTHKMEKRDVYTNEAFYLRTQHENQEIANVLENKELHDYFEKISGLQVDSNRLIETPELIEFQRNQLIFTSTPRENIAYRLNVTFYNKENKVHKEELYYITSNNENSRVIFDLTNSVNNYSPTYFKFTIDVVDLNTSIGFETKEMMLDNVVKR